MEKFKDFIKNFRGAIIGGIIAIIALTLQLHKVVIAIIIVICGILLGNYIQHNKDFVKEKLKFYIDRF